MSAAEAHRNAPLRRELLKCFAPERGIIVGQNFLWSASLQEDCLQLLGDQLSGARPQPTPNREAAGATIDQCQIHLSPVVCHVHPNPFPDVIHLQAALLPLHRRGIDGLALAASFDNLSDILPGDRRIHPSYKIEGAVHTWMSSGAMHFCDLLFHVGAADGAAHRGAADGRL